MAATAPGWNRGKQQELDLRWCILAAFGDTFCHIWEPWHSGQRYQLMAPKPSGLSLCLKSLESDPHLLPRRGTQDWEREREGTKWICHFVDTDEKDEPESSPTVPWNCWKPSAAWWTGPWSLVPGLTVQPLGEVLTCAFLIRLVCAIEKMLLCSFCSVIVYTHSRPILDPSNHVYPFKRNADAFQKSTFCHIVCTFFHFIHSRLKDFCVRGNS